VGDSTWRSSVGCDCLCVPVISIGRLRFV
jgi:hypothetical protein